MITPEEILKEVVGLSISEDTETITMTQDSFKKCIKAALSQPDKTVDKEVPHDFRCPICDKAFEHYYQSIDCFDKHNKTVEVLKEVRGALSRALKWDIKADEPRPVERHDILASYIKDTIAALDALIEGK